MNYLILLGAMIALFYKAFYCGYVVDDVIMVDLFKTYRKDFKEGKIGLLFYSKMCLYGAGFFKNAKQEYAFTLTLHYINCCLIYSISGSLIASLLYLLNPINNQTALWMNGRRYAVTITAVLLAWKFKSFALPLFAFCAYVHIGGLVAPLLLLWTPYWGFVPIIGIIGAIIFKTNMLEKFIARQKEFKAGNENQNLNWRKGILYVKSVGYNFVNCIFPFKPAMYHNYLFYFSNTKEDNEECYKIGFDFFKGLAVLGFLLYMIVMQHNFWAFWFLLFISPWCNVYQITMNFSDRYCSLANVGAMILLAGLITHLPGQYQMPICAAFFVLYFLKYQPLFRAYTSVENFYLYHLNQQPDLVNPRYYLARHYLTHKDVYSAFATLKVGLKYRPFDFRMLLGMMEVLMQLGKIEPALKVMEVAEKNVPMLEVEDCKVFFDGLREQFKRDIENISYRNKMRNKNVHNHGNPITK